MVKTKSNKKKKDPNKPKRPLTAFMRFSQSRRAVLKKQNPNASMTDISKLIGQEWKVTDKKVLQPYHDQSAKEHEIYKAKMDIYNKSKPKRPRTAYALFMKANRQKIADKHLNTTPRDLMKYIAADWKALSSVEKKKYQDLAKADKERWEKDKQILNT